MGGTISYRNRFPLPDNWNVTDFICAIVPVPNDAQYISMLRGLLDSLTWQRSFTLHPTENAAYQVSKTWQACLASRELQFTLCGGAAVLRMAAGCKLEVQDCTDPNVWHPVVTSQPPGSGGYDPRFDDQPSVPYVTPPVGQDGACLAAANATEAIKQAADDISNTLNTGGAIPLLRSALLELFHVFLSIVIDVITMGALQQVLVQLNPATVRADFLAFVWQDLTDLLVCYYEPDGTMTSARYYQLLDALAAAIIGGNQMWAIAHFFVLAAGPKGMQRAATYAGILAATCGPCGEWEHTLNFTTGANLFTFYEYCAGYPAGEMNANGINQKYTLEPNCVDNFNILTAVRLFNAHLTYVRIEGNLVNGSSGTRVVVKGNIVDGRGTTNYIYQPDVPTGPFVYAVSPVGDTNGIELYIDFAAQNAAWDVYFTSLTVRGTGPDPFI